MPRKLCVFFCHSTRLHYLCSNILTPLPIRTARSGWVFLFIDMAKIAYYGGWWFQDTALFSNPARLAKTILNMDEELGRSDEEFIKAFKSKYTNHFPPSWIMLEITTFGTMSILYSNLNSGRCKRQIAKYFGVADTVMVSFPLCKEPIGRNRALPSG